MYRVAEVGTRSRAVRLLAMLAAVVCTAVAVPLPAAATTGPTTRDAERIYYRSTESFMILKRSRPRGFDWGDDACSVPTGLRVSVRTLNFAASTFADQCRQHDFAYRNFGGSRDLDPSNRRRKEVDEFFLEQMKRRCRQPDVRRARRVTVCLGYAYVFYASVRAFGRL